MSVYEQYTTNNNNGILYDVYYEGQTFTSPVDFTISSAEFLLVRVSSGCGTMTCYLYAVDGSHFPTGSALATSAAIDSSTVTTDAGGEWVEFTFSSAYSCTANTEYALYLVPSGGDVSNRVDVKYDSSALSYQGGAKLYSSDGGSSWSYLTTSETAFKTNGSGAKALYDYYNGTAVSYTASILNAANDWAGQSFTPTQDYTISDIVIFTKKGAGDNVGTVTFALYAVDGSGHPTGAALASGTVDDADVLTTYSWVPCELDSTYNLSNGTKYAVVVHGDSLDASNTLILNRDNLAGSSDYANGDAEFSVDGGSSWITTTTEDYLFRVYGQAGNISATIPITSSLSAGVTYQAWRRFLTEYMPGYSATLGSLTLDTGTLTLDTVTSGILWSDSGVVTGDARLDQLANPNTDKTFTMGASTVTWNFTNPVGGMKWQWTGGASGHLFTLSQNTGNVAAGTHLLHIDATDADVHLAHLQHADATYTALQVDVTGDTEGIGRFNALADGTLQWGNGTDAVDTNLYRSAADTLKTDDSFQCDTAVIGHTDLNSAVLRLNNDADACRLIFDVEGLAGAGRQSWAFQTDRNENGDFTLLRGTVGATPGTVVLHSDASGNIGVGKYSPGTLLDVNGTITALDLNLTDTSPYITCFNTTQEDTNFGRESRLIFRGTRANTTTGTVAIIEGSHIGTGDDDAGQIAWYVNGATEGDNPSLRMVLGEEGDLELKTGAYTMYQEGAGNITSGSSLLAGMSAIFANDGSVSGSVGDIVMASRVAPDSVKTAVIFDYSAGGINHDTLANVHQDVNTDAAPTFYNLTLTNGAGDNVTRLNLSSVVSAFNTFGYTGAGADEKYWDAGVTSDAQFVLRALNDAQSAATTFFKVTRSGYQTLVPMFTPKASVTDPGAIALALRDPSNNAYGFDFYLETSVSGDLELHRVINSVNTEVLHINRADGEVSFAVFPLTPSAAPDADYEVANKKYVDDSVGAVTDEKVKIDAAATADYIGAANSDGVLRTSTGISYTDGGDYVTLGLDVPSLTELAVAPAQSTDFVLIYDTDAGSHKKIQPTNLGHRYVDRGDPAAFDFQVGDFTTDFTWRDLDLSSIVPAGAVAVNLSVILEDGTINNVVDFRQNGNSNIYNKSRCSVLVTNTNCPYDIIVPCDSNRIIEYRGTNTTFTTIDVVVKGWWI